MIRYLSILSLVLVAAGPSVTAAENPAEITLDASAAPENLTTTRDGTLFFGSTSTGTIYRALPGEAMAEPWIQGDEAGLTNVLGVLADEASETLWVCDNAPFGRRNQAAEGLPALRTFDLNTGEAKATYPARGGGVLNDVALASDGTAYASDTFGGRILRLAPGGEELEVWVADPQLRGVDGLALLADGSLYVNNFFNGTLSRIAIEDDGSAGAIVVMETSVAFTRPDGMRVSGPMSLIQAEGQGRLTEITINGDHGEVRVIQEGLTGAMGVSLVDTTAYVLVERRRAVAVQDAVEPAVENDAESERRTLTGRDAMGDWTTDAPGVRRLITVDDMATPYDTPSARNWPRVVPRPEGAWPEAPEGFEVTEFATGFNEPRVIVCAPNGDLFIAESRANQIRVLRDADGDGTPEVSEVFATGLSRPFGIAFYPVGPDPEYVYIGNTNSVVRFPYANGDLNATGDAETVVANLASGNERVGGGGHWTRDLQFSLDGETLYVAVGSRSNVSDDDSEARRARIFAYDPDGTNERVYAHGIRNPVGLAVHPETGELWASVNERDGLGDNLVPDFITSIQEDGFYGWPWYYIGPNQDPRHEGAHPELRDQVIVPDVLLQSHMASIDMTFYDGEQFPDEYRHEGFAAEHGSWNRSRRVGYKVIRIPMEDGVATGEYEDFLVGFVTPDGDVWGRPAGVVVAQDGSLLVTDDGSGTVWRVEYTGAGE